VPLVEWPFSKPNPYYSFVIIFLSKMINICDMYFCAPCS
jgi:hypothetical protein